MANQELIKKILARMISEYEGDIETMNLPLMRTAARHEACEVERLAREARINAMRTEVYALFDLAQRMDHCVQDDDDEGYFDARITACRLLSDPLKERPPESNQREPKSAQSPSTGAKDRPTWTTERKNEVNQSVKRGISGIHGFRFRKRNGRKDPGNYAGKVCLITWHGWNPIVVPGGVEQLLKAQGHWEKYAKDWPTDSKRVPFKPEDRFHIEWERLSDGTRSYLRIAAP